MRQLPALTLLIRRPVAIVLFAALVAAAAGGLFIAAAAPLAATSPGLGAADSFAILAATDITDLVPPSAIIGDVGLSPAAGSSDHLTTAEVTGTIYSVDGSGPPGSTNDPVLLGNAQAANTAAFAALIAAPNAHCDTDYGGVVKELDGLTLVPGVYCANAFHLKGTLTLSDGSVADTWIFRSDLSTLVTTPAVGAKVVFLNGIGSPCNVWWRVASSATIGGGTAFIGNILALTSITLGTGASVRGRLFAQTGEVTLLSNAITRPSCAALFGTATVIVAATQTQGPLATQTSVAATQTQGPLATQTSVAATQTSVAATQTQIAAETQTQIARPTGTPGPQNTSVPTATNTPLPAPTASATAPAVVGLPQTGGGPLPGEEFPWSQALVFGGLGAIALGLGVGAYRRRARGPTR
jgi:type VI secretion system secreted protein VgrG